jgi:predicted peptidase
MRLLCHFFLIAWCWSNIACTSSRYQKGYVMVSNHKDSLWAKEAIKQIKLQPNAKFDTGIFTDTSQQIIQYRFFTPQQQKQTLPLVLVFHGSGAIGTDNSSQLGVLAKLFASDTIQKQQACYVLAPQFSTRSADYFFDSTRKAFSSFARPCLQSVLQLVDSLKQLPGVDPQRIYVIGFSMGGSTVMNALAKRPDLFAAGISIAGIPPLNSHRIKIPVWLIHGNQDSDNLIESDRQFYKERKKVTPLRFTELEGVGHDDIFKSFIVGNSLPNWLFQYHK